MRRCCTGCRPKCFRFLCVDRCRSCRNSICRSFGNVSYRQRMVACRLGSLMGFLRLAFSFSAGLLLSRVFRPRRINGAFWIAAIVIVAVMVCPYAGGSEPSVMNAVYDSVCSLIVFPAVVALGACGVTTDRWSTAVCGFVGRISYPLYITHYPVMYLFYAWVWKNNIPYETHCLCVRCFSLV